MIFRTKGLALIATISLSACGGTTVETPPVKSFANNETIRMAHQEVISDLPGVLLNDVAPGAARYDALYQVYREQPFTTQTRRTIIATSTGTLNVTGFSDPDGLTATFSDFVTPNDDEVSGTVTLQSDRLSNSHNPQPGPNRFGGAVTGMLTASGTGTVFDTGYDMSSNFFTYVSGPNATGLTTTVSRFDEAQGIAYSTGRMTAVRTP